MVAGVPRRPALARCLAAWLVVVSCVLAPRTVAAQATASIRGTVVAAADSSPLGGVHVILESTPLRASFHSVTDASGQFVFSALPPGPCVLLVRTDGFSPERVALDVQPREVRSLALRLSIQPVEASVEVSAPTEVLSTHSPSSTVVSARRLETLPLAVRTSLSDAMAAAAPGMVKGHDDFVHVRGEELALNPSINGVTFWENPHAVFSAALSPGVIASANVMTGGFPAEYGNRFGGILDVVTRSGWTMEERGEATVGGGGAGRRSVSAGYGGHADRTAYYVFGSWGRTSRFLSPPEPRAIHDEGTTGHGFAQFDVTVDPAHSLQVIVMGDATTFEVPQTAAEAAVRHADASQRNLQQTLIASWRHAPAGPAVLSTSVYQRWSEARLAPAVDPLAAYARYDRSLVTVGVKSEYQRVAARHSVKAGADVVFLGPTESLDYRYGGFRALSHLLALPHQHFGADIAFEGRRRGGAAALFVQDSIAATGRLTLDVGVRADAYRVVESAAHVSPRVNVAYTAGGAVFHASYNHLFSPPPIEGLLASSAGLTRDIREIDRALPPLGSTVGHQVEAGVGRAVAAALRLSATAYYRRSDRPVHTTVWPDARVYSYASFDSAQSYGVEVKVERPDTAGRRVSGYVNYALGRSWFHGPVVGGFVADAHELGEAERFLAPMDQTHTMTAGLTLRHDPSRSRVTVGLLSGSGTPVHHHEEGDAHASAPAGSSADATERMPGYLTGNVTLAVDVLPKRLEFELSVENVSNRLVALSAESVFSPAQYGIQRLWSAALRWSF